MLTYQDTTTNDLLRQMLASTGSRFGSVAFVKKDGTVRHMTYVNAKARARHMVGSERGERASATFRANNPHMMRVWDNAKGAFRTVTLSRIIALRVDGKNYRVRSYQEATKG